MFAAGEVDDVAVNSMVMLLPLSTQERMAQS
jgi:hypothetical protein